MRIYQLFHGIIEKFIPMDKQAQDDLQLEAVKVYNDILDERTYITLTNQDTEKTNSLNFGEIGYIKRELIPFKIKHRVVGFMDQWYMRYLNAFLFVYLVPKIKAYINGETPGEADDDDDDDSQDEFNQFLEFQRFKKSML